MTPESSNNLDLIKSQLGLSTMAPLEKTAKNLTADKSHGKDADKKRWKAALDFETMFLAQMYKGMRKSTIAEDNDLTKASPGRDIFTEMLDNTYAGMNAKNPAIAGDQGMENAMKGVSNSLAAQIYRSLSRKEGGAAAEGLAPAPMPMAKVSVPNLDESSGDDEAYAFSTAPFMANLIKQRARAGQPAAVSSLSDAVVKPIVDLASKTYGVSANLIQSVIKAESNNQPLAVSDAGAKGMMQLMDSTARDMGVRNAFNANDNILGGTRYLKQMLDRFGGDEKKALAAYNAGPAVVDRFNGVPPYDETKAYVEKVLRSKKSLDDAGAQSATGAGK